MWRKLNPMLKLYYTRISLNSHRRASEVALLERQIAFEPIALNLDGDQFKPDFLAINPFHRIPVLVDEDLTGGVAGNSRLSGGGIPHPCTVNPC
ncbi:glutathione S-transferase family protein [Microcoleus sp. Pol12A5]|uniref:glutathione S-transferase family protein n=1 Tax=Microcoleus sp. Pol12A5 TaxID=3055392 RepID=UPI002FCF041A